MQRCPRPDCNRAGDDIGRCADRHVIGCAAEKMGPVDVNPSTDVVIRCLSCNVTRAFTVDQVMKGRRMGDICQGQTDQCRAVVLSGKALAK